MVTEIHSYAMFSIMAGAVMANYLIAWNNKERICNKTSEPSFTDSKKIWLGIL